MSQANFFSHTILDLRACLTEEDRNIAFASLLVNYLHRTFDTRTGAWQGRDMDATLRRTCHALEALQCFDLGVHTAHMLREGTNWLIRLPAGDTTTAGERDRTRLRPTRFKTLSYLNQMDDEPVIADFQKLLSCEADGLVRGVTVSDILGTCVALDTIATLKRYKFQKEICSQDKLDRMIAAIDLRLAAFQRDSWGGASEITNLRDLSYVIRVAYTFKSDKARNDQASWARKYLLDKIQAPAHSYDFRTFLYVLYVACALAVMPANDDGTRDRLYSLLNELRDLYTMPQSVVKWDFAIHSQVLKLLTIIHDSADLKQEVVSQVFGTEIHGEMLSVIRNHVSIRLGNIQQLSGGFTEDEVYRVPFSFGFPAPLSNDNVNGNTGELVNASVIIKRSTSTSFAAATNNYRLLPRSLRSLFVQEPTDTNVFKSGITPSYYLLMEDLGGLQTLHDILDNLDTIPLPEECDDLIACAAQTTCGALFTMFSPTLKTRSLFPGAQLARLYLSPIETKVGVALNRVPWLRNPVRSFYVADQHYQKLDFYLSVLMKYASELQPPNLGLTHGDFHSRNVMLDQSCTHLKLIDLDKLSWAGDYLADLGTMLTDVCVSRRLIEKPRSYRLPIEDVALVSRSGKGVSANEVHYPPLVRPVTLRFQHVVLDAAGKFAAEIADAKWKERLWLACAASLLTRLAYQTEKEYVAVLYGESVRLLHELSRHLEQGIPLPQLLFSEAISNLDNRPISTSDQPLWLRQSSQLQALHDRLISAGMRPDTDFRCVTYVANDGKPILKLVPPAREGIGRILLPREKLQTVVKLIQKLPIMLRISRIERDGFSTILVLTDDMNVQRIVEMLKKTVSGTELHPTASQSRSRK
jgi:hypothetical protein